MIMSRYLRKGRVATMAVVEDVIRVLRADPHVTDVRLVGSRKEGCEGPLSDWDFEVDTSDVESVAEALPHLLASLRPIYQFWDPLTQGPPWNYIVMLPGPTMLDLHFQRQHDPESPWRVNADTLQEIDTHFWDWALYMAKKGIKGDLSLVDAELRKMYWFLLSPMGVASSPLTIRQAIADYLQAREARQVEFQVKVVRRVQREAAKALRIAGLSVAGN